MVPAGIVSDEVSPVEVIPDWKSAEVVTAGTDPRTDWKAPERVVVPELETVVPDQAITVPPVAVVVPVRTTVVAGITSAVRLLFVGEVESVPVISLVGGMAKAVNATEAARMAEAERKDLFMGAVMGLC